MIAHEVSSIDWTQAHEWVLLVLVLLGLFTLARWAMWTVGRAGLWLSERRQKSKLRDDEIAAALARIADLLEGKEGQ